VRLMRFPFNRKSPAERLIEKVADSLDVPGGIKSPGKPAKAGLIAGAGLAALTAASAGISSLRRQDRH
jgi:hypothetical protein